MRKLLVSIAAAGTMLALSAPASAQYMPGYGGGYGNAYAYGYGGGAQRWQRELQQIRFQRDELARSGRLSHYEAWDLDRDIRSTERSIFFSSRNGIGWREAQNLDSRIWHLRNELRRYADRDGRNWGNRYDRDDHRDRDYDHRDRDDHRDWGDNHDRD